MLEQVERIVADWNFGHATAAKRGRTPAKPYVPVSDASDGLSRDERRRHIDRLCRCHAIACKKGGHELTKTLISMIDRHSSALEAGNARPENSEPL